MGELTITHDGTTGELLAHIAELQRKASAYDALIADLRGQHQDITKSRDINREKVTMHSGSRDGMYFLGRAHAFDQVLNDITDLA